MFSAENEELLRGGMVNIVQCLIAIEEAPKHPHGS